MSAQHVTAEALAALGVSICVLMAMAVAVPRPQLARLHFLTPVSSMGAPLIGAGLAVDTGWHRASVTVVLTVVVIAATGPVLTATTARIVAQRQRLIPEDLPQ